MDFLNSLTPKELKLLNDENLVKNVKNFKEFEVWVLSNNHLSNDHLEIRKLYNELSFRNKKIFNSLNLNLFRRSLVLRNKYGLIDHFNLNYHPIYSHYFHTLVLNIKSNCFYKEISNTQNTSPNIYLINSNTMIEFLANFLKNIDLNLAVINEKFRLSNEIEKKIERESNRKKNSIVRFKSLYKDSMDKRMQYAAFLVTMLEKLNMQDQSDVMNDILFKTYINLNDQEILYLIEKPETILNFIINDTNIFKMNTDGNYKKESLSKKILKNIEKTILKYKNSEKFDQSKNRRNNFYESKLNF